ncbi:type II secretion system F family protein [Pseudonocardia sp.]|uniref:type II secretion system F family protein n=1 Tax=Pseudonocardia sp. TaxID=60912 RepID=UPI002605C219|nr:type II secretion system F family protein [Pseudonocardia sp.]
MTPAELAAAAAGACVAVALVVLGGRATGEQLVAAPATPWVRRIRLAWAAAGDPARPDADRRRRALGWAVAGVVVWALSGWPAAGAATAAAGLWLPWLLGSTRVVRTRIEKLEALEGWCRRMADTLTGGGAIGLAQAIVTTTARVDDPIAPAVRTLARRIRDGAGGDDHAAALRAFADTVDDRTGDTVAAALLLALRQQSGGIAEVLRQLADGVARDVRARRDIEAARAESRQSIRILLLIQAALLVLIGLVPTFAAPYGTPVGQVVMAVLLSGSAVLLVWMRQLALGRPSPRFFGKAGEFAKTEGATAGNSLVGLP